MTSIKIRFSNYLTDYQEDVFKEVLLKEHGVSDIRREDVPGDVIDSDGPCSIYTLAVANKEKASELTDDWVFCVENEGCPHVNFPSCCASFMA